jgi:hypothetical protein
VVTDNFNFFIPVEIVKGSKPGQEMKIKGVCSSEVEDTDGEVLVPAGYDITPLLTSGFLNYNHQANKDASAIIGEPTKAEIRNDGKDLYIEGFLYSDSEEAKKVYKLAQVLEKNSPNRRLGFSIEGKALERDPLNEKRITKAKITGVAITPMPKNPNTLMNIVKGEYAEAFVELDKEEEKEMDKAMTAAMGEGVTSKESVDGGVKKFETLQKDIKNSTLKKSDVYDRIIEKYSLADNVEKAQKIYQLTLDFNKKLYNMEGNEVLSKALDNTFAFIDEHINILKSQVETKESETVADDLKKSEGLAEVGDVVNKNAENGGEIAPLSAQSGVAVAKSDEADVVKSEGLDSVFEKSLTTFIKSEIEKGNTADSIVDGMVMKGMDAEFCSTLVKGCVEEMSALKENGGETSTLQKGEEGTAVKGTEETITLEGQALKPAVLQEDFDKTLELVKGEMQTSFQKGQIDFATRLQSKFEAFGNIVKSLKDEINLVKGENKTTKDSLGTLQTENEQLKKSLSDAQGAIEGFAKTPHPLKSVVTAKAVEKFENQNIQKSQTSAQVRVLDLNDKAHAEYLLDTLTNEFQKATKSGSIEKSDTNDPLGNAVMDLAMTRKISNRSLQDIDTVLTGLNIKVVNNE